MDSQPYPFYATEIFDGTKSVTVTADRLSSTNIKVTGVEITASKSNTDVIYIGNSTSQNRPLYKGDRVFIAISDLSKIYLKSASGTQSISYFGVY